MLGIGIFGATGKVGSLLIGEILACKDTVLSSVYVRNELQYNIPSSVLITKDMDSFIESNQIIIDFSSPEATQNLLEHALKNPIPLVIGTTGLNAEQMDFPGNQGLIASCSAVQWFDSPERFFRRCSDLLTDNGYFSFSTFGKQNLCEVASITGNALEYRSLEELKDTLRPHYELLHVSEELIHLSFPSPLDVLKHLLSFPFPLFTIYTPILPDERLILRDRKDKSDKTDD